MFLKVKVTFHRLIQNAIIIMMESNKYCKSGDMNRQFRYINAQQKLPIQRNTATLSKIILRLQIYCFIFEICRLCVRNEIHFQKSIFIFFCF